MAGEVREIPLWPGCEQPKMMIFTPNGVPPMHRTAAMVVFRGGAYRINNGSGAGTAEYFAARGILAAAVEYRTVEGPGACAVGSLGRLFPKPIHDAVRAMRLLRQLAPELSADPNRIGVCGFSAGGHLATMLCSAELPCQEAPEDDLTHLSFRPDVCILGYPVISLLPGLRGPSNLSQSAENLGCSEDETELLSAELRVSQRHPPTFIWHTREDTIVPDAHAEAYSKALDERGIANRLLLFDKGPHGLGLALAGDFANNWIDEMFLWLGRWASPQLCVPVPVL